jgi:hypothetical protein
MIALSVMFRGRTMSLGGVFMILSCFVMCFFDMWCPLIAAFGSQSVRSILLKWDPL